MKINLKLIKEKRINKELSITEMASALDLSDASQYWKRENGDYNFKSAELPILAIKLDIPFEQLFLSSQISKTEITSHSSKTKRSAV